MFQDLTWVAEASPRKLVVRHRSSRLILLLFFSFGSLFFAVAIIDTSALRWVAGALAFVNYWIAVYRSCVVTITFDRDAGVVECLEQRLHVKKSATLPLKEFTGVQIVRAGAGRLRTKLGLTTREGVFLPIEQTFSSGERTDVARTIEQWLGVDAAGDQPPEGQGA